MIDKEDIKIIACIIGAFIASIIMLPIVANFMLWWGGIVSKIFGM